MGAGFLVPIESDRPAIIEPVNLGRDGITYLHSLLLEQQKPLSSSVAKLWNSGGISFAPLEKGKPVKEAKQFSVGTSRPTIAIQKWLSAYIDSQWGNKNYQLIFEDPWAKPSDSEKRAPKTNYFFCDDGVYYVPDNADAYTTIEIAKHQSNFLFFGFVVSPVVPLPPSGKNVDQDYIVLLACNITAVFAIAYDFEGYVVWQR